MKKSVTPAARRVAASLLQFGPQTVPELAERLELTTTAVRRQLDALVEQRCVQVQEDVPYGPRFPRRRGRPARYYSLTSTGRAEFDHDYDALAVAALNFIAVNVGADAVSEFARQRVEEVLGGVAAEVDVGADLPQRVEQVSAALSARGFAAAVESTRNGAVQMCQHHCPIAEVAEQYPQFCEAEREFLSSVIGTHVTRLATIGTGGLVCTTHIPVVDEPSIPHLSEVDPLPMAERTPV